MGDAGTFVAIFSIGRNLSGWSAFLRKREVAAMVFILVLFTFSVCILVTVAFEVSMRRMEARNKASENPLAEPIGFHSGHTWASLGPSGEATIGLDRFAREIFGTDGPFELPKDGSAARQGEPLFSAIRDGRRIDFVSPLDGIVSRTNGESLESPAPEMQEGRWFVGIRPRDFHGNLQRLRTGDDAAKWLDGERKAFREFLTANTGNLRYAGVTMQDGGLHVEGFLGRMNEEIFTRFVNRFLR